MTKPQRIGTDRAAHPAIAAANGRLAAAWLDYTTGPGARVIVCISSDAGEPWGEPMALRTTIGASDHPQLTTRGREIHLTRLTEAEGLRVVRITG